MTAVQGEPGRPRARRSWQARRPRLRHRVIITLLLAASGWLALAVTAFAGPGGFRFVIVCGFALVCPGAAVVRLLPLREVPERAVLAVAVGASLAALVAQVTAIRHILNPAVALAALAALCTAAAAADLALGVRTP